MRFPGRAAAVQALAKGVADVEVVVNNLHVPVTRGASGSPSTTGD
jgi:hypothetical protein